MDSRACAALRKKQRNEREPVRNEAQKKSNRGRDSVQEKIIREINSLDTANEAPGENET
jgi:hypothetical protein